MSKGISDGDRASIAESLDVFRDREVMNPRRAPSITYTEVYRAMNKSSGPVTHIKELSENLDVSIGTIRHRLHNMEEHDVITRKKMGERTEVWYFPASEDDDPFHPLNFVRFRKFLEDEVLSDE